MSDMDDFARQIQEAKKRAGLHIPYRSDDPDNELEAELDQVMAEREVALASTSEKVSTKKGLRRAPTEEEWMAAIPKEELQRCGYCNKSKSQVKKLILGANANICDKCIAVVNNVLAAFGGGNGRELKVVRASDIGMEATNWLWEDEHGQWVPEGALSLMAGREGVGKSTVVTYMVARLTNGTLPGENFGTSRCVII